MSGASGSGDFLQRSFKSQLKGAERPASEFGTLKEEEQKDIVEVTQFSDTYFRLTELNDGRFSKFFALTEPVLIRLNGKNYRISPVKSKL